MRAFYTQSGHLRGIVIGGAAVGTVWIATEVNSVAKTIKARRVTQPAQRKPRDTASGSEEASRENKPCADAQEDQHG